MYDGQHELVARRIPSAGGQATLTSTSWIPAPDGATLASPLPAGDNARRVHVPGCGEEPEITGCRRDDLRGELVRGVQQPHERAADA